MASDSSTTQVRMLFWTRAGVDKNTRTGDMVRSGTIAGAPAGHSLPVTVKPRVLRPVHSHTSTTCSNPRRPTSGSKRPLPTSPVILEEARSLIMVQKQLEGDRRVQYPAPRQDSVARMTATLPVLSTERGSTLDRVLPRIACLWGDAPRVAYRANVGTVPA
ncbi:hypothetical protein BC628DRAFT_453087 [Trametes gibbosa]|nr:hypothetical protein BC628DRAFT_453087 [Trametes gibbosa]